MLTVTTPAANLRLTTVAAVRAEFGITADNLADSGVEALIDRASSAAAKFCERVFASEGVRETFWNVCDGTIRLTRTPARSIAVVEDDVALVEGTDFDTDAETFKLIRLSDGAPTIWRAKKIVIDYTAGYVLPDDEGDRTLPADIEQAVIYLVGDMWKVIQQGQLGAVKREMVEGIAQIEWWQPTALRKLSNQISEFFLEPYQRITFG